MTELLPRLRPPPGFTIRRPNRTKSAEATLSAGAALALDLRLPADPWDWKTDILPVNGPLREETITKHIRLLIYGDQSVLIHAYGRFIPFAYTVENTFSSLDLHNVVKSSAADLKAYANLNWELCDTVLTDIPTKPCPHWHCASGYTGKDHVFLKPLINTMAALIDPSFIGSRVFLQNGIITTYGSCLKGSLVFAKDRQNAKPLVWAVRSIPAVEDLLSSHKVLVHRSGIDSDGFATMGEIQAIDGWSIDPISNHDLYQTLELYPELSTYLTHTP